MLRVTNFLELRWNPYHDSFFLLQAASLSYFKDTYPRVFWTRCSLVEVFLYNIYIYIIILYFILYMSSIAKIFLQLLGIDHSLSDDSVIVCRFVTTYFVDHLWNHLKYPASSRDLIDHCFVRCTRKLNDTVIFWRHSKIIKYSTIFFTETLCVVWNSSINLILFVRFTNSFLQ
jgi:hypothetical protein